MSKFPYDFDTPDTLYQVQDLLKVTLAKDYNPGDQAIYTEGDISKFPPTGIITLVDQCTDNRAISFKYNNKSKDAFYSLEPTGITSFKPKKLTAITMQLRAEHHNAIKDSIIAIQMALGHKHETDKEPYGKTIIGRVNFIKNLVYSPKAWFEVDKKMGLVPFNVTFKSVSSGDPNCLYTWDFGDGNKIETTDTEIQKLYYTPGIYDVTLTVRNSYGEDTATIKGVIIARTESPEEAVITFSPHSDQILYPGPVLRTGVNQYVMLEIEPGEHEGVSNAGELLENQSPIDSIVKYKWVLNDNLAHDNAPTTRAAYTIGGLYDLILRTDTKLGAYRITRINKCIDVVEMHNLWLWNWSGESVTAYEYSLNAETFKNAGSKLNIPLDDSFLKTEYEKKEFWRNNGFAPKNGPSGAGGTGLLFWASENDINSANFNGFTGIYTPSPAIKRPWNWASFVSKDRVYFILGAVGSHPPAISPANPKKTDLNLFSHTSTNNDYLFINGSQEVLFNPAVFDDEGTSLYGDVSSYRTTWKDQTGYMLRNEGSGDNFNMRSFYKTTGNIGMPFQALQKLSSVPGNRLDAEIVPLSNGIYLFDDTGSGYLFRENTETWEAAPAKFPKGPFRATSDGYHRAYLSFENSNFIKFNEIDLTFSSLGKRPQGEQWQIQIF